jgi:hypothetical protein
VTDTFTTTEAAFSSCQPAVDCANQGGGIVTWQLPAFTGTRYLTLTLASNGAFSGTLTNTAQISATTPHTIDPAGNNTAQAAAPVRYPSADLQISKVRLGSGTLVQGDFITYTLTITNAPGAETVNAVVTDTFENAAISSAAIGFAGASCTQASPVVCTIPAFPNTAEITFAAGLIAVDRTRPTTWSARRWFAPPLPTAVCFQQNPAGQRGDYCRFAAHLHPDPHQPRPGHGGVQITDFHRRGQRGRQRGQHRRYLQTNANGLCPITGSTTPRSSLLVLNARPATPAR